MRLLDYKGSAYTEYSSAGSTLEGTRINGNPLTIYAIHWSNHLRHSNDIDDDLFGPIEKFLASPHEPTAVLLAWCKIPRYLDHLSIFGHTWLPIKDPLNLACQLGLGNVFHRWLQRGRSDHLLSKGETDLLLLSAVRGNNPKIVETLVSNGAGRQ